jgi:succinate dehydrogenase / fumarate reductase cytochrome b subunit
MGGETVSNPTSDNKLSKARNRPVDLGLGTILRNNASVTSMVSIAHRISGIILFIGVGYFIYVLGESLQSERAFLNISQVLQDQALAKFMAFAFLSALIFHMVAGFKHLLMDFGLGESKKSGPILAWVALVIALALIAMVGGCLYVN